MFQEGITRLLTQGSNHNSLSSKIPLNLLLVIILSKTCVENCLFLYLSLLNQQKCFETIEPLSLSYQLNILI